MRVLILVFHIDVIWYQVFLQFSINVLLSKVIIVKRSLFLSLSPVNLTSHLVQDLFEISFTTLEIPGSYYHRW